METLLQKQIHFTRMIAELIDYAAELKLDLTFGEAYRTPEQAKWNAQHGSGIVNSLHTQRLAVDFNLFKDGIWLNKSDDFKALGEFWESLGGSWGGRFSKPDGNHFSIEHNGVK